jgi:hypothetical protein
MQANFKPARIVRFVAASELYPGTICDFDKTKNILRINREIYNSLTERQKTKVFRSNETIASF